MEKYYLDIVEEGHNNAGSKAIQDCNRILFEEGYKPWTIRIKRNGSRIVKRISNGLGFLNIMKIPYNCILVIPHPIYINKKVYRYFKRLQKKKPCSFSFYCS
jgi:hypothetical protein